MYLPLNICASILIDWRYILAETSLKCRGTDIIGLLCKAIHHSFFVCIEMVKLAIRIVPHNHRFLFLLGRRERSLSSQCVFCFVFFFLKELNVYLIFLSLVLLFTGRQLPEYHSVYWKKLVSDDSDHNKSFVCFRH